MQMIHNMSLDQKTTDWAQEEVIIIVMLKPGHIPQTKREVVLKSIKKKQLFVISVTGDVA